MRQISLGFLPSSLLIFRVWHHHLLCGPSQSVWAQFFCFWLLRMGFCVYLVLSFPHHCSTLLFLTWPHAKPLFRAACVSFLYHSSVIESFIAYPSPPQKIETLWSDPLCFLPTTLASLRAFTHAVLRACRALPPLVLLANFSCSLNSLLRYHFLWEAELSASSFSQPWSDLT